MSSHVFPATGFLISHATKRKRKQVEDFQRSLSRQPNVGSTAFQGVRDAFTRVTHWMEAGIGTLDIVDPSGAA